MITKMLLKYIPKYIGNALDSPTYLIDRHIPFNKKKDPKSRVTDVH